MKTIISVFLGAVLASSSAHAFEFIKCNSVGGKTLWASFGKKMTSGDPAPTYFPVELTLFRSPTELQDRIFFRSSKDAAGIPVEVNSGSIKFMFPAKGADGSIQTEAFRMRVYSPGKSSTAYIGEWATGKETLETREQIFCSVY